MASDGTQCAIVICLDVGPSMTQAPANHETSLDMSCRAISTLLQKKVFAESKDEIALVLFGTDETANHLAHEGYSNIKQVRPIGQADFDLIQYVEKEIQPGSVSADFIDALVVGLDLLHNSTNGKKFTSTRILLFSNLGAPFSDDKIDSLINGIQKMKTDVNLIGPNLDEDDETNGDENQPSTSRGRGSGDYTKQKTPQQRAGAALMKHFLQEIDGGSYKFSDIIPMLSYFDKREVKAMPWKCTLDIGEDLKIACSGYLKTQEGKLKKCWSSIYMKSKEKEYKPQHVSSYHLNNDEETEIEKDDIVDAYRYGTDLIPMSKEDKESMAYKSPGKSLQTLGFTKEENVKPSMRVGTSVYCFVADPADPHAAIAFSGMVNALYETKTVIVVRRCYSARSMPQIGYLAPQIKANYETLSFTSRMVLCESLNNDLISVLEWGCEWLVNFNHKKTNLMSLSHARALNFPPVCMGLMPIPTSEDIPDVNVNVHVDVPDEVLLTTRRKACCLYYTELPYAEDLKQYTFSSLFGSKKQQPTDDQLQAMDNLITSMELPEREDEEEEPFKPHKLPNPYLQRIYQCLQQRALHPGEPLPQPNPIITQTLQSKRALEARCSSELENMKKQFKLELNEKDKNIETGSSLWKVSDNGEPLNNITKTEDNENVSMQSIAKGVVTKVGTVDPVKDFRAMITRNNVEEFGKVCSEMKTQINELLKQSFGKIINSKVIDCIRALREECCIYDKPLIFNTFLEELKVTLPIILKGDFWQELQNAGITLIENSECNSSSVTKDAAIKFLQEQKDESDDNLIKSPEEDEDDLLNMM